MIHFESAGALMLLVALGCGGGTAPASAPASAPAPAPAPASAPAPAPASASAPAPASASAPAPAPARPTGGSVLFGDIAAPKGFDPKATLEAASPAILSCYADARATRPSLRGKLRLRFVVNEGGRVISVDADAGEPAYDAALVDCIGRVLRETPFAKPGGTATILAPLVLRP